MQVYGSLFRQRADTLLNVIRRTAEKKRVMQASRLELAMPSYRIYELKSDGQFTGPPCDVACSDDKTAAEIAQGMMPDAVPEIWLGTRRLEYDPTPLTDRSGLWRAEADRATTPEMRSFCLCQAECCDGHVMLSRLILGARDSRTSSGRATN
jgi:hypothetical protein